MKKLLLLSGALAVAVAAQAGAPRSAADCMKKSQQRYELAKKGPRYAAEKGIWLPGTVTSYYWNSWETNSWEQTGTTNYTYNERGQKIKEVSGDEIRTYEYAADGQVTCLTVAGSEGLRYKTEYSYDEITGKQIGEAYYNYTEGQWALGNKWEMHITRDAKGNITRIDDYSSNYETGEMELGGYCVYSYGADGKISEIINYDVYEGETEVEFHLKDIVWENTNGQLIVDDTNDMDADDYCMGDNRVKSGTLLDFDGDEGVTAYVTVEYTGESGSLRMKMTINNTVFYQYDLTILDSYGSYREDLKEKDYEVNGTTVTFGDEYTEINSEKYDAYGILTEYVSESHSNDYEYTSKRVAEVTYDATYGYPTLVVTKGSSNGEEMQPQSKEEYGDYAIYDGVASIIADDNAPVEYYNLHGVRVSNPATGVYIRRQGSTVTKVYVK